MMDYHVLITVSTEMDKDAVIVMLFGIVFVLALFPIIGCLTKRIKGNMNVKK